MVPTSHDLAELAGHLAERRVGAAVSLLAEDRADGGSEAEADGELEAIPGDVAALARFRFEPEFAPAHLTTQGSVARILGHRRGHVLSEITEPAQLIAPIAAAMLASDGYLGPTQAFVLQELSGKPGRDTQVFGVHKEHRWGSVERRFGVAVIGPDSLLPVTGHALVTATRDDCALADPDRLRVAQEAMRRWGFDPPSTIADHAAQHLQLIEAARGILERATARGSQGLRAAGVNPGKMLDGGFARWMLCGRIQYGPRTSRSIGSAGRIFEPGLDSALLRTVREAGYYPVFRAGDSVTEPGDQTGRLALLNQSVSLTGSDLFIPLYRGDTKAVPGMRWLTEPEVDVLVDEIRRRRLPITLTGTRIALIPRGLAVTCGPPEWVAGIVLATPAKTTLMVTPVDVSQDKWVTPALMALLALQISENSVWAACPSRFHQDCAIFEEQASSYHGRNGLRMLKTISNLFVVGVARTAQDEPARN